MQINTENERFGAGVRIRVVEREVTLLFEVEASANLGRGENGEPAPVGISIRLEGTDVSRPLLEYEELAQKMAEAGLEIPGIGVVPARPVTWEYFVASRYGDSEFIQAEQGPGELRY